MPARASRRPGVTDPVLRLTAQAGAWAPAARRALAAAGVAPGWRCADLGCGPAGILDLLSRRVGRRGLVVGVEHDPHALLAALAAARGNVRLVPADVRRTGLPDASFDLVHARLVCQETGLLPLLREMRRLVRPGGVVLLAEPGADPWEVDPAPPDYARLVRRVTRRFLRRRSAIGSALPGRLRRAGLLGVRWRRDRLSLRGGHPYAAMPLFALAGARDVLLGSGAVTPARLRQLEAALGRAAADPAVRHRSFPLWHVWGRAPR
jgi:SAM-dependent methyltransferase